MSMLLLKLKADADIIDQGLDNSCFHGKNEVIHCFYYTILNIKGILSRVERRIERQYTVRCKDVLVDLRDISL